MRKEEIELERLEKIRTEIKKIVKKPYVVPVILAVVTLLIIFAKVQDNQAGKGTSAPESSKQNRTEVKESNPTPDSFQYFQWDKSPYI